MKKTNQHQDQSAGSIHLSRRKFLGSSAALAGAAGLAQVSLASPLGMSVSGSGRDAIISIYLRGAMDGLAGIVPYADPDYASERGSLAVLPPGAGTGRALDLDGFFGLNPTGQALMRPFGDGKLLFVHASGLSVPNRSHFDAQKRMESATPDNQATPETTGWVGRHLQNTPPAGAGNLRGIGIGNLLPITLAGGPGTLPVADIGGYDFPGRAVTRASRRSALGDQYLTASPVLSASAASTLAAIDLLDAVDYENYTPAAGVDYPNGPFGEALSQVAAMLKANVDLETAQVNFGGWDHHSNLAPLNGRFASKFNELSRGLEAFYLDLLGTSSGYTVLVQTEFGRRIRPNGSAGTDHGFASCMMAMGPSVLGGRVLSDWPGMAPESSPGAGDGDQVNGDLAVTIDWRDIAAEILERRAGNTDLASVFPGYTPTFRGAVV